MQSRPWITSTSAAGARYADAPPIFPALNRCAKNALNMNDLSSNFFVNMRRSALNSSEKYRGPSLSTGWNEVFSKQNRIRFSTAQLR